MTLCDVFSEAYEEPYATTIDQTHLSENGEDTLQGDQRAYIASKWGI